MSKAQRARGAEPQARRTSATDRAVLDVTHRRHIGPDVGALRALPRRHPESHTNLRHFPDRRGNEDAGTAAGRSSTA